MAHAWKEGLRGMPWAMRLGVLSAPDQSLKVNLACYYIGRNMNPNNNALGSKLSIYMRCTYFKNF
jgi:hypothetical protein